MINKGLSHYQSVQKSVSARENSHLLEVIMEKATLYDMSFLQNRALLEAVVDLPDQKIDMKMMLQMGNCLLWLHQTQEEAKLS